MPDRLFPDPPEPWERVSTERVGDFGIFQVRRDLARSPLTGKVHEWTVAEAPDGAIALALTAGGEMVFVEQYRHPLREVSLELPAGIVDEGEAPEAAGLRELREEAGFVGESAEWLGALDLNPSWQTTRVHVLLVRGARGGAGKELDEAEDTRVRLLSPARVRELVLRGEIRSATAVAALGLYWAR